MCVCTRQSRASELIRFIPPNDVLFPSKQTPHALFKVVNGSSNSNRNSTNSVVTYVASQRSLPPQFHPTAPSISNFSRQLPSSRHLFSAAPIALSVAPAGAGDDNGIATMNADEISTDSRNCFRLLLTPPTPPTSLSAFPFSYSSLSTRFIFVELLEWVLDLEVDENEATPERLNCKINNFNRSIPKSFAEAIIQHLIYVG